MDAVHGVKYFLGSNSAAGFFSLYDQLIDLEQARRVYILKGGPGCGKSTLMGMVGQNMEEMGTTVEYILCSGDPDSLDGVVFPELGVALVDGTAPQGSGPKSTAGSVGNNRGRGGNTDDSNFHNYGAGKLIFCSAWKELDRYFLKNELLEIFFSAF